MGRWAIGRTLSDAQPSAYETVTAYLKKLRPIQDAAGRADDWLQFVQDIRERYRNRPKFMEMLDRLDDRPIVSSRRPRPRG